MSMTKHERGRSWLSAGAAMATLLLMFLPMPSAQAVAPPANDLFAHAKHISLGFAQTLGTRGATTDSTDVAANQECGAPTTDASVWYQLAPTVDQTALLSSGGSNYSVGFIVVTGSPTAFTLQACGPGAIRFVASAGQVYNIMVFDDQTDGSGNGGSLHLTTKIGPPPPSIAVTISHAQLQKKTHAVSLAGTFTCKRARQGVGFGVLLSQRAGRVTLVGSNFLERPGSACNGKSHAWSMVITASGRYAGGKATAEILGEACGRGGLCANLDLRQVIRIHG